MEQRAGAARLLEANELRSHDNNKLPPSCIGGLATILANMSADEHPPACLRAPRGCELPFSQNKLQNPRRVTGHDGTNISAMLYSKLPWESAKLVRVQPLHTAPPKFRRVPERLW